MKLLKTWLDYVSTASSPLVFKEAAFYGLIASALQRRVWIEKGIDTLYPNVFIILVGDASTGKGQLIRPVKDLLELVRRSSDVFSTEFPIESTTLTRTMTNEPAFPMPPDSTTLRGLTNSISEISISYNTKGYAEKTGKHNLPGTFPAAPVCYWLDEFSSLIKTQTETKELTRFLTNIWDNRTFKHHTHTSGTDNIINPCLTLVAGATPDFLKDAMVGRYLQEGFNSRTNYVYGEKSEDRKWIRTGQSGDQLRAAEILRKRLLDLSRLFGEVTLTDEANDWCADWYENRFRSDRKNPNALVTDWYNRKDMHLLKYAMLVHFADKNDYIITLEDVLTAKDYVDKIEINMHHAFKYVGANKNNDVRVKILSMLKDAPMTEMALGLQLTSDIGFKELQTLLKELRELGQIKLQGLKYHACNRDNR